MGKKLKKFKDVDHVAASLESADYICSKTIATVVFLAQATQKPVLVEGPAGVGKTELSKAVARSLGRELIRLQCYEGLDETKALYEWEYAKQLLYTQMVKEKIDDVVSGAQNLPEAVDRIAAQEDAFFSERFIQPRPLLQAISSAQPVVLLVDEVDKSDPEFEAFLLEVLSDYQVSIPELGTRTARNIPHVFLTSNDSRDMSDALKRRCIHLYIDYPDHDLETRIVRLKIPLIKDRLAGPVDRCHPQDSGSGSEKEALCFGNPGLGASPDCTSNRRPVCGSGQRYLKCDSQISGRCGSGEGEAGSNHK